MAVLLGSLLAQIEFFEQRIAAWSADPTAIGLTAPQVVELASDIGVARVAYNSAQAARIASRDATVDFYNGTEGTSPASCLMLSPSSLA